MPSNRTNLRTLTTVLSHLESAERLLLSLPPALFREASVTIGAYSVKQAIEHLSAQHATEHVAVTGRLPDGKES